MIYGSRLSIGDDIIFLVSPVCSCFMEIYSFSTKDEPLLTKGGEKDKDTDEDKN